MVNRFKLTPVLLLLLFLSPLAISAQDSTDDASSAPYNDGFDVGDNGGTNFSSWSFVVDDGGGANIAEALAIDATSVGGDASMNTAGRTFALHVDQDDYPANLSAYRPFSTFAFGGKVRFRIEYVGDAGFDPAAWFALEESSLSLVRVQAGSGSPNWRVSGSVFTDTGIARTNPVQVTLTHVSTGTFDVRVEELVAPFDVFTASGLSYANSGHPDVFHFHAIDFSGGGDHLLFNDLLVNPAGTVPVELSAFMLE